jgi:RimJ/RimL family protein N-acetyltransferase
MNLPLPPALAIPTLETPRLVLRGLTLADFADLAAMWADPDVVRHVGGRPQTREESWDRFLRMAGGWALLGYGNFVVCERATGRFVGVVGYFHRERDIEPSFGDAPEAGWVLASSAHGKGYATEAVRAATEWLMERLGPVRTVCMIDTANVASIRVALKCGFRRWTEAVYHGEPVILFERDPAAGAVGESQAS